MSAAAAGGGSKGGGGGDSGREIDLTTLSIDQLNRLKQQLEQVRVGRAWARERLDRDS